MYLSFRWTLESLGALDARKSVLEDDFEEEEEKDENEQDALEEEVVHEKVCSTIFLTIVEVFYLFIYFYVAVVSLF